MQATGSIDVAIWAVLITDTAPILVAYTILDGRVGGKIVIDKSDHTLSLADAKGDIITKVPVTTDSKYDPLPLKNWRPA